MYFKNISTLEELRNQYKKLLKVYHPDNPNGSEEATKAINAEYEKLFNSLKHSAKQTQTETSQKSTTDFDIELDKAMREVISKIANLEGINIEICGSWLWVSGNTYIHKDIIKSAGFKWSKNKACWYWHRGEYRRTGRKSYSMDYIRFRHGSVSVDNSDYKAYSLG